MTQERWISPRPRRAEDLFREQQDRTARRVDRMLAWLMVGQWALALGYALAADHGSRHPDVLAAASLGAILTGVPIACVVRAPGRSATRHVIAVTQMLWSALLIHVSGGRIETHFHILGSLAFLASYRDWRILPGAVLTVLVDHLVRGALWPASVYGVTDPAWWRFFEHAGWVTFEAVFVAIACRAGERDLGRWAVSRAEAEQLSAKLDEQRTLLACQSDASLEGALVMSPTGEVLSANRRFHELWRLDEPITRGNREAVITAAAAQVVDAGQFLASTAALRANPDLELVELLELKDGRVIERYSTPVRSAAGGRIGRGWYFRDVTVRVRGDAEVRALNAALEQRTTALAAANRELERRVEELRQTHDQLLLADRLSSLGRVAASIGHEINNPLSYVIGNLEELGRSQPLSPEARELLGEALEGSERVRRIVGGLKSISRASTARREPVDLHATLESTVRMASNELRHRGRLIRDYGALPLIEGDASRLGQVFLNLIVNATHALTGPRDGGHFIAIRTFTDPTGRAVVEIEDTGEGIPADRIPRLFDPFFTTKELGTGLGLSICHGIVSEHGGAIEVDSVVGRGSRFRIALPGLPGLPKTAEGDARAAAAPPAAPAAAPAAAPTRAILLVDDDTRVLRSLARSLARRHDVEACEGAAPALALLAAGRRFDAILCDLHMPGITGAEFYHRLRDQFPGLEHTIIFMTGGAFTAEATEFTRACPNPMIDKPVDLAEVDKLIQEVAAATGPAARPGRAAAQ